MPYRESDYLSQPPANVRDAAKRYRIDYWRQVNVQDLREVKAQLNAGFPVMIGVDADSGLLRLQRGSIWSSASGAPGGGHAMLVVAYDDARSAFKFINSWGTGWADDGYGWIAYGYFPQVVKEGFVAKDAINGSPVVQGPQSNPRVEVPAATSFQVTGVQHNVATWLGFGNAV
jgi:C1A family cysteine protease